MRYVIVGIDESIVNAIEWDGISDFIHPFPHKELIQSEIIQIGMKLNNGVWEYPEIEEDLQPS